MTGDEEYVTLVSDGYRTRYLDVGSRSAPPVVLLHDGGFGSDAHSSWGRLIPFLTSSYRVLAPDLLGYGGSSKFFDFETDARTQRARHVAAFCRALDLSRPVFIGSSFGGSLVLHGAAYGGLAMSAGVSIAGTGGPFMNHEAFRTLHDYAPSPESAQQLAAMLMRTPSADEVQRRLVASSLPAHWKALAAARLQFPYAEAVASPQGREQQYLDRLRKVDLPLLFIAGTDDPLLAFGWEKELAKTVGNGDSAVIPDAGHLTQVDQPEKTAEHIKDFLGRNSASA